jgi:D-3-phosphoglycerate dehydrogenase
LAKGYLLFGEHLDCPGIIGRVGTLLGASDVNISFMQVGRHQPRGRAVMILGLDEPINEELRQQLMAIPDIYSVKLAKL